MAYDQETLKEVRRRIEYIYENYPGDGLEKIAEGLALVEGQLREMEADNV